ncbi:MAG: HNH endonuclease [Acidobacteriaceae bacterium]
MLCFWCDNDFDRLTDDHIVPQSLGGTLDFKVPSCESCQTILSKAEHEVARKSILAIHALVSQVKPRHPNRTTSGHLKPSYLLVKNPLGGYGETLLSSGEKMRSLAHFEVKVVPGEPVEARVRGTTATEAQLLLDLYRGAFEKRVGPGELVCEFTANLEVDPETAADPDFWPRIVLLPGNRLMFRARNPEELIRFAKAFNVIALSNYKVDASKWNSDVRITGATPHRIALRYDPQCMRRVAAKIGYALFSTVTKRKMEAGEDERMRRYILGTETFLDEPVSIAPDPITFTTSDDPHYIVLSPAHDRSTAFVSLYGFDFRVELGASAVLPEPIVVICEIDGSGMRLGSKEEISNLTELLKTFAFSQPWLQQKKID